MKAKFTTRFTTITNNKSYHSRKYFKAKWDIDHPKYFIVIDWLPSITSVNNNDTTTLTFSFFFWSITFTFEEKKN